MSFRNFSFSRFLLDLLPIFKKLFLIIQREDLILSHVKIYVEIALYALEEGTHCGTSTEKHVWEYFNDSRTIKKQKQQQ
jgi:predicted type IV restriction endonuclease